MAYCAAVAAVVTTTKVNINSPGFTTADGVTLTAGTSRILLTGQTTTPSQNGVWIYQGSSSALTRPASPDPFASGAVLDNATAVPAAAGGTTWGGSRWWVNTPATAKITVGTTAITLIRQDAGPVQARVGSSTNVNTSSPAGLIFPNAAPVWDVDLSQVTWNGYGLILYPGSSSGAQYPPFGSFVIGGPHSILLLRMFCSGSNTIAAG